MIVSIVGARPQFIKAAVVSRALAAAGLTERIVHTGQHYDDAMSGAFLRELDIRNIAAQLRCGSGSHAVQTATMMVEIEKYLLGLPDPPQCVLVYGDTNSTIAGALVAAKLHIPVAHVEAGLRSFNREMPEEINRITTDHLSSILFCSSEEGVQQLAREGITQEVHDVGDVMLDAFEHFSRVARGRPLGPDLTCLLDAQYGLLTIHRPSNTDDDKNLDAILAQMEQVGRTIVWPVHPRLRDRIQQHRIPTNIRLVGPQGYLSMLALLHGSEWVVTDSGGLQKEAYWARKRCYTVRRETEWIETLRGGWNRLFDPRNECLATLLEQFPSTPWEQLYGDGRASQRIAERLCRWLGQNRA